MCSVCSMYYEMFVFMFTGSVSINVWVYAVCRECVLRFVLRCMGR